MAGIEPWYVDQVCARCPHLWRLGWSLEGPRIQVCVHERSVARTPVQVEATRNGIEIKELVDCPDKPRAARYAGTGV